MASEEILRSIVVTSPAGDEGASTFSANLAAVAAEAGVRTVVVECDVRRPTLAHYLDVKPTTVLNEVLSGKASIGDALVSVDGWTSFALIAGGSDGARPSGAVSQTRIRELLMDLDLRFDLTILDAPPILADADVRVLAVEATGTILVVRQGQTQRAQVARAVELLEAVNARFIGAVLNMVPETDASRYYR
jgi:non-specific protein-tyrosine kinase